MGATTSRRYVLAVLAGLGIGLTAAAVSAHHSQSAYEPTKTITIEGTMQAISWANPHSLFFVNAHIVGDASAATKKWAIEGPAPRALEQAGWSRGDTKIGDKITMTGRPHRDGKPELLVTSLVTAAGKQVNFRPDGPGAPQN
jgi:hypothetical protein